jgi:hypothetical protein
VLQNTPTINNPIINSPTINNATFSGSFGNITVGTLTATGTITGNSNLSIAGNATITGNLTVSGTITSNQITQGWNTIGTTLTYSANNGNREFVVTTGTDQTGVLSPGMKVKVSRSVTPPTQCMAFASASNQYATKSSPSGITFTSAFTCEAWVYLNSYLSGDQYIVSRSDAITSGWALVIKPSGQIKGFYGGSSVFTEIDSYQSVPLKTWTHIAFAVTNASTKSMAIYMNGTNIASNVASSAASTVTQANNLSMGAANAGVASSFFNGYLSEVRVWSVGQTQANIQANMAINLTGSETNLVALFKGGGNFNDLTSNANTLTAGGGAIATQAANPYNATEYGIITAITSSTITMFTGKQCTIPNMTLNTPQYSVSRTPFGFPAGSDKWTVSSLYLAFLDQGAVAQGTSKWMNAQLSVPTGEWVGMIQMNNYTRYASGSINNSFDLSTTSASLSSTSPFYTNMYFIGIAEAMANISITSPVTVPSQTIYYFNARPNGSGTTSAFAIHADFQPSVIAFECAYV